MPWTRLGWRVVLLAGLAVAAFLSLAWLLAPDPRGQIPRAPLPATAAIFDRHGTLLYEALDPLQGKGSFVPLRELPAHLLRATIATEDATFYSNPGVDPLAILRALWQNWRGEGIVSGGSTLTQQLARNLWMSPSERGEQSLWRKLREAALALRLSARLGKDEILELYLNSAPYGHQAVGVDAAARVYFGKSARDLDLAESALLAGLPQAPSAYDPLADLSRARARQRVVLSLMVRQGYIGEGDARVAAAEPLRLSTAAFPVRAPHFVAYVRQLMVEQIGLDPIQTGGLRVHTTLDLGLQEIAEATVSRHVAALADKNVRSGALVALDPATGGILAMVGSADYFDPAIDGEVNVTLAARQPGSSIKPILYAAALENRAATAATVLYDVPTSFLTADGKSYAPENYDRVWHGPVSVRESLANSLNLPTVSLMQRVGMGAFLDVAHRAGIATLSSRSAGDLSLALGSGEVRPLDLASAYASMAAGGVGRDPVAILRVEDPQGRVLWQPDASRERRVVSPQVAYLVTDILSDDDARSMAFGPSGPLRLSRPAAAKTGTTTDWRDNWTVGYTPELLAAVWVGNADNSAMRGVSGISGAAPIWHDFMEEALKGRPESEFREPPGLVRLEVCPETGELPSQWCPNRRVELFLEGTAPTASCSWHRPLRIDRSTGLLAGPGCPPELVEERVFQFVPPELQMWARERGVPEPTAEPCTTHGPADPDSGRRPRLLLTSPSQGGVLQITPDLPRELQRVEVAAAGSGLGSRVRVDLLVDGVPLATFEEPPYRATWQLSPGRHLFRAVALDPDGETLAWDELSITVEGSPSTP
ncbi:MAG: penicillin-binding protein 1C [Chloroflexota bacterium]